MIFLDIVESAFGSILIGIDRLSGAHVYYQHGWCQSESDHRGVSHAPYIHALYGFVAQTPANEVLVIGCAGGTLPTMLSRADHRVIVVDIDPISIAIARRYFSLDRSIFFAFSDGLEWLMSSDQTFDCVIVNAFQGGEIPSHLCSLEFFRLIASRLSADGLMLMNVVEENDQCRLVSSIVESLQTIGLFVRLFEQDGVTDRNVIVLAGAVQGLRRPSMLMRPNGATERLAQQLGQMRFRVAQPASASIQAGMPENLAVGARSRTVQSSFKAKAF